MNLNLNLDDGTIYDRVITTYRHEAKRHLVTAARRLNLAEFCDTVDAEITIGYHAKELVMRLTGSVLADQFQKIDIEEKWPSDWRQAFKERWFPKFLLKRFPVQYKTVSVHREIAAKTCPHIDNGSHRNDQTVHFEWLRKPFDMPDAARK